MIIPDINLLVYAYNRADPQHEPARKWWEATLNEARPVAIPWIVSSGFIRLVTHPRVLKTPMEVNDATDHVRTWLAQPCAFIVEPGSRFPGLFLGLVEDLGTAGNLTTDAYLAALAIEHQAELNSSDSDFNRCSGLRWKNPLN